MARSSEEDYDELLDEHDHGEASDFEEHAYEDDIIDEDEDGAAAGSRPSKSRKIQKKEGKVKRFFKCHCNRVISATSVGVHMKSKFHPPCPPGWRPEFYTMKELGAVEDPQPPPGFVPRDIGVGGRNGGGGMGDEGPDSSTDYVMAARSRMGTRGSSSLMHLGSGRGSVSIQVRFCPQPSSKKSYSKNTITQVPIVTVKCASVSNLSSCDVGRIGWDEKDASVCLLRNLPLL